MIDLWTVTYRSPSGEGETVTAYAYPSGGVGLYASDPILAEILGPTRSLVSTPDQAGAEAVAGRLADMVSHLTGGSVEYHQIYGQDEQLAA